MAFFLGKTLQISFNDLLNFIGSGKTLPTRHCRLVAVAASKGACQLGKKNGNVIMPYHSAKLTINYKYP